MENVLEISHLKKTFHKGKTSYPAVREISFSVQRGSCVGIVGESGCGKTTVAKMIACLCRPDAGSICLNGKELAGIRRKNRKEIYRQMQMVFQNPQDSFDPRRRLGDGIMEGMRNRGISKKEAETKMKQLLAMVELEEAHARCYPHEVSGGQCQRAAIARALAAEPDLLICDEATSALDVTVQAEILKLLERLRREMGLSILLICHDLALVQHFCDYVLVMNDGKIVEEGVPDEVIRHPKTQVTKLLLSSVF